MSTLPDDTQPDNADVQPNQAPGDAAMGPAPAPDSSTQTQTGAPSTASDFDVNQGNTTYNQPYSPPQEIPTVIRAAEPADSAPTQEGSETPEHDLEDEQTKLRSEGVGQGQDAEATGK